MAVCFCRLTITLLPVTSRGLLYSRTYVVHHFILLRCRDPSHAPTFSHHHLCVGDRGLSALALIYLFIDPVNHGGLMVNEIYLVEPQPKLSFRVFDGV